MMPRRRRRVVLASARGAPRAIKSPRVLDGRSVTMKRRVFHPTPGPSDWHPWLTSFVARDARRTWLVWVS